MCELDSLKFIYIKISPELILPFFTHTFREKEIWQNKVLVPTTHHQEHSNHADKKIDNNILDNNLDVS